MPTVKLAPIVNDTIFSPTDGSQAASYQLFFYQAGTTTKQNTYTTSAGSVAHSNPITLNSYGRIPTAGSVWFADGQSYKIVIASPTDTDPPSSPYTLADNVTGINDTGVDAAIDQWIATGLTPTYVSATSFTVTGDQTSLLHVGRRLKSTVTGGTAYSTITASAYGAVTTITVVNDSTPLDSGLSAVNYSILSSTNPAIPKIALPDGSTATTQSADNNSTKLATTAYCDTQSRQESGNFSGIVAITTTPYTLLAANAGKLHTCASSAAAITMVAIADVTTGDAYTIVNHLATAITVTRDGSSTFSGVNGSTTTVSIPAYSSVTIVKTDTAVWSVTAFVGNASMRVLDSGNFTSVASKAFVLSTLDSTQLTTNVYLLRLIGYQPATDDSELQMTISSDGGSSYIAGVGYYGMLAGYASNGGNTNHTGSGVAFWTIAGQTTAGSGLSNVANETAATDLILTNFNTGTSLFPHVKISTSYWCGTANLYSIQTGAASNNATAADIDAFKIAFDAGNIAAVGSYVLYKLA